MQHTVIGIKQPSDDRQNIKIFIAPGIKKKLYEVGVHDCVVMYATFSVSLKPLTFS